MIFKLIKQNKLELIIVTILISKNWIYYVKL